MHELTTNENRAQQLAESFRAEHGLGGSPIKDMYELVHVAKGIDVISMKVPDTDHRLSMCDPASGRVVILVATTPHPMRQRSSIAHELGHVLAGDLDQDRTPDSRRTVAGGDPRGRFCASPAASSESDPGPAHR